MITVLLLVAGLACFALFFKSVDYFDEKYKRMMLILFLLSVAVFGYQYTLIKPESF